jgi:hypothetical protein
MELRRAITGFPLQGLISIEGGRRLVVDCTNRFTAQNYISPSTPKGFACLSTYTGTPAKKECFSMGAATVSRTGLPESSRILCQKYRRILVIKTATLKCRAPNSAQPESTFGVYLKSHMSTQWSAHFVVEPTQTRTSKWRTFKELGGTW